MPRPSRLVVFSDLDGTLLDHDTYSYSPALPALERLRKRKVPVVLTTSKTLPEVVALREELGLDAPFIVENGAAAVAPSGEFSGWGEAQEGGWDAHLFGQPRGEVLADLRALREGRGYRFTGFADMSDADVAAHTGLTVENAGLARQRLGTEPLVWQDTEDRLAEFREDLAARGLRLVRGGRFQHVLGRFDKAVALGWVRDRLREREPGVEWITVALGDSPNDADMLSAADYAVVIRSKLSDQLRPEPRIETVRTRAAGPAGWREAMDQLLPKLLGEEPTDG